MKVCGIDEAGRGPVVGPMVMAGVVIEEKNIVRLKNIGVKDSKLLAPNVRERMFEQIKEIVKDYKIIIVSSKQIDESLTSKTLNLNQLEGVTSAKIINELKPDIAYLDCPSNNIPSFTEYVISFLTHKTKIVAEHKADLTYPVVSAASILAKVTRDREIEKLKRKHNVEFGSGYPSDPTTVKFLKENYNKYDFFRKSWISWKRVAEGKKQSSLGNFK